VADEGEECLCLAVLDAPVRLRGLLGRVANPFLKF
jgi:putative transcriptional regulator